MPAASLRYAGRCFRWEAAAVFARGLSCLSSARSAGCSSKCACSRFEFSNSSRSSFALACTGKTPLLHPRLPKMPQICLAMHSGIFILPYRGQSPQEEALQRCWEVEGAQGKRLLQRSGDRQCRLTSLIVFLVRDFSTSSPRYLRASTDACVSFVNGHSPSEAPAPACIKASGDTPLRSVQLQLWKQTLDLGLRSLRRPWS